MTFPLTPDQDDVRKDALLALTSEFVRQGHPIQYAKHMATATIFQADLDLRNAQLSRLLAWLKDNHNDVYPQALEIVEGVRQEFERRLTGDF
jgi:hypothetical protein